MGWTALGWMLGRLLWAACCLPGAHRWADGWGRSARSGLPWRLASGAARTLAEPRRLRRSAAGGALLGLPVLVMGGHWIMAVSVAGAGIVSAIALARAGLPENALLARGRLWLAMASSSELAMSMGRKPGGPQCLDAGLERRAGEPPLPLRGRRLVWHAGFLEMARRMARPMDGDETEQELRARVRLRAMMLACAGSENAARWLWRRRRSQWTMAGWAASYGEGAAAGGERWEMSHALGSWAAGVSPRGTSQVLPMDAKEASESSLPLLWAKPAAPESWREGGAFEVDVRRECMAALGGASRPSMGWGWRAPSERAEAFKMRMASCMRRALPAWALLGSCSKELFEAEALEGAAPLGGVRGKATRRL